MENNKEWFELWFNTPFYHILYKERDWKEAEQFIVNLHQHLNLNSNHKVLDLCCGRGRHSITLNKLGVNVMGVDLSTSNIEYAKQFENDTLKFQIHDMRCVLYKNHFSHIFNLFTSFGYFENIDDHQTTLNAIYQNLKPKGIFVLDFLNAAKVKQMLPSKELKQIEGIDFVISKSLEQNFIVKKINFKYRQNEFSFQEKVAAFSFNQLKTLTENSGFSLIQSFGSYQLDSFNENTSERLVMVLQKKAG